MWEPTVFTFLLNTWCMSGTCPFKNFKGRERGTEFHSGPASCGEALSHAPCHRASPLAHSMAKRPAFRP